MNVSENAKPLILQTYRWPARLRYLYRQIFKDGKHRLLERFGLDFVEAFDLMMGDKQMTITHVGGNCAVCILEVAGEPTTYISWEELEDIRKLQPKNFTTIWVYGDDLETLQDIYHTLRAGIPLPVA